MTNIETNKIYSGAIAPEVVTEKIKGTTYIYVPYIISDEDNAYTWQYLVFKPSNYNYEGMINTIIGLKYSLSQTLAIMNNYLGDNKNAKYKKEFKELQECRAAAKTYAKKFFNKESEQE